ncbi:dockerin type I domain-containing protein [Stieleria varia]|nr:dockerin type I domain-containing protein [Stieleria varia]
MSRRPQVESLEDRRLLAVDISLAASTATVNSDGAADEMLITVDTTTAGGPLLQHNRFTAGDVGYASDLDWDSTVAGEQTLAALATSTINIANMGAGDDTIRIVRGNDGVTGSGDINAFIDTDAGGPGDDTIIVDDSTRTASGVYSYSSASTEFTGPALTVDLGMAHEGGFFLITGTGNDTVNVDSTFGGPQEVNLNSAGGTDTVNINAVASVLLSNINIANTPASSIVNIDASGDAAATYTVADGQITSSLTAAAINYVGADLLELHLQTGDDVDVVNVTGTTALVPTTIQTNGGADQITVTASMVSGLTIDGGDPTASPGDTLTVDVVGTTGANLSVPGAGSGEFTFDGGTTISYSDIESVGTVNGAVTVAPIQTGAGDDAIVLQLIGGDTVVTSNGTEIFRLSTASVTSLTIDGQAGDDSLTVDIAGGLPTFPITFNGQGNVSSMPGDQLMIVDSSGLVVVNDATYTYLNNNDGNVNLDGSLITYTGLEPVTASITATNVTMNYSAASETITAVDAGGGMTTVDSTLGETTTFTNPTNSLTINTGGGTDTVNVDGLNFATSGLTINDVDGDDTVNFQTAPTNLGTGNLSVNTGAGTTNINEPLTAGSLVIDSGGGVTNINTPTITTTASQSYRDPVLLLGDLLTTGVGVGFFATLDGGFNLTLNDSDVALNTAFFGDVGLITPLASITTDAAGETGIGNSIGISVVTTGPQTYNDPVKTFESGLSVTITSMGGAITFASTIDDNAGSDDTLVINSGGGPASFGGVIGGIVPFASMTVNTNGPFALGQNTTVVGDLTINVPDTPALNVDNLTINNAAVITSNTGNVLFNVGDDADIQAGTTVNAPAGTLTVNVDPIPPADMDVGTGSSLILAGTITAISAAVNGGNDNDTFTITPSVSTPIAVDGNDPVGPSVPGDQLIYIGNATKTINGAGIGTLSQAGFADVTFQEIETLQTDAGNTFDDVVNVAALPGGADGLANNITIEIDASGQFIDILFDGDTTDASPAVLFSRQLINSVGTITVNGSTDDDTLTVNHGNGLVGINPITFNGGAGFDSLQVTGNPGVTIARETYIVGATEDAGTWVLDPNDSAGPGAAGAFDGDESVIVFTGLEPVDTDVPVGTFDVVFAAGNADDITIENGGLLVGADSIRVIDNNATFETFRFANKTTTRLHLNDGADIATLNYTTPAAGLTTLEVYGHGAAGVVGVIAEDNAADLFRLDATADNAAVGPAFDTSVFGQGGDDLFNNFAGVIPPGGNNSLVALSGRINIDGGDGMNDVIGLNAQADAGPMAVTLTSTQLTGATPGTIDYANAEALHLNTTDADDTIDILSTNVATTYLVSGRSGNDTFTIGNSTADFNGNVFDGSLAAIAGQVIISPDDTTSANDMDTLNVDASGDAALAGVASIDNIGSDSIAFDAFANTGNTTRLAGFAPANIDYRHDDTSGGHLAVGGNRLEFLNVRASTGTDTINVNATTAVDTTTVDAFTGNDNATVTINGDGLSANNVFSGNTGNDNFVLNVTANLGATSFVDLTSLQINGDAPAADSSNRDTLTINDNSGTARDLVFDYLDTAGDLDVNPGVGGGLGAGVEDIPVNVRTMETVVYNGSGAADNVSVEGTSGDDDLTVAPLTPNSALVFLDGDPWDGPSEGSQFDQFPGVAGGGNGPDLQIAGVVSSGIRVAGGGAGAAGDQLYVYAVSEADLVDAATTIDPFGFGAGVIIPGSTNNPGLFPSAYDLINIANNTSVVTITNDRTVPGAVPPSTPSVLLPVVPAAGTFAQTDPLIPGLVVNGGFEAAPAADGIGDDILAFLSTVLPIRINGGDPDPALAPMGDRLQVFTFNEINVFSDKSTPPIVSVTSTISGTPTLPLSFSSIENTILTSGPGAQQVNLIGDNNDPTVDQNDNFVVVGRDVDSTLGSLAAVYPGSVIDPIFEPDPDGANEFTLQINGSAPIGFRNVTDLNVFGDDRPDLLTPGTPSIANDIDTLDITPFADDTPLGWGLDVSFDEGNPAGTDGAQADLIIYNTSAFGGQVSEAIVVRPSGQDNGEIVVTNLGFGTPIVDIDFVANTDIIINDNDGFLNDTDTLTLLGTNPDNPGTSGNETIIADFTAAGGVGTQQVLVQDGAAILYAVRSFTGFTSLNVNPLGGADTLNFTPDTANANGLQNVTINYDGGDPVASDILIVNANAGARITQGVDSTSGLVDQLGAGVGNVNYINTELLNVTSATAASTLTVRGTHDEDAIAFAPTATANEARVWINDGTVITANSGGANANFGTVSVQGRFGDDTFSVVPVAGVAATIAGGDGDDEVSVTGTAVVDAITYTPTAVDGGTIAVTGLGLVTLSTVEGLSLDGAAPTTPAGDTLNVPTVNAVHTPGGVPGAGLIEPVDASGNPLLALNYASIETVAITGGTVVIQGTDEDDTITVSAAGIVTVTNELGFNNVTDVSGFTSVVINALGGDDTFNVLGGTPFNLNLIGGDNGDGSDVLNYTQAGAATLDLANEHIDEPVGGAVETTYSGIETINMTQAAFALTVEGHDGANDVFVVTPVGANDVMLQRNGVFPVVNANNTTGTISVDGLGGTGDQLIYNGTAVADAITVNPTDVTHTGFRTINFATVEDLEVHAGDGDDTVTVVGATAAFLTVFGDDGDDTITGGSNAELIFGGNGNDVISGMGGADTIDGEAGNDTITGGTGADNLFGGADSDLIIWNNGDGSDLMEGGTGNDRVQVNGAGAAASSEMYTVGPNGSRVSLARTNLVAFTLDIAQVEQLDLNTDSSSDNAEVVTVNSLVGTDLQVLNLDAGGDTNNSFVLNGNDSAETISIGPNEQILGLGPVINTTLTVGGASSDEITINANGGDDTITVNAAVNVDLILNGGQGDDVINAAGQTDAAPSLTINGGAGDDHLVGGSGNDTINGDAGEDTMVGGPGNDTFDGGADFDTILIAGTSGADIIDVFQAAPTTLNHTVNGDAQVDTLVASTVEQAHIVAGAGADLIRVNWLDAHGVNAAVDSLRMTVDGGSDVTSDRLVVVDDGTDDLVLYRKGQSNDSGTVQVGPGNAEPLLNVFSGIEFVDFVDENGVAIDNSGGPQLTVFKHDPFELNNDRFTATYLGSGSTINVDPTIDPGPLANPFGDGQNLGGDRDYYRLVAESTGTLDLQVYFRQIGALASGRPGLPNNGNLDINVRDAAGNVIAGFGANDATDDERVRIPAVAGETYYLEVFGNGGNAINVYNFSVVNHAPPVPYALELLDNPADGTTNPPGGSVNSDTGRSQFDNHTYDNTPTLFFRLDDGIFLHDLPGNPVNGTPPDEVIPIPFRAGLAQPNQPGFAIAIFDEGNTPPQTGTAPQTPLGFATAVPGQEGIYTFTVPNALALSEGSHFLSARVQMIDPAVAQETGYGDRSLPLEIVVDVTPPNVVFGTLGTGLHPDSDSGDPAVAATLTDGITNDLTPTFFGRAEANSIIRAYVDADNNGLLDPAIDVLIGQTVTTPLDGTNQAPTGEWEITSTVNMNDPTLLGGLGFDGLRRIFVTAEDLAGNISNPVGDTLEIFMDTQGPQVTGVFISDFPAFNIFTLKPESPQPTPRVDSLTISVQDLPARIAPFFYNALSNVPPLAPLVLVGDHNGIIPIQNLVFNPSPLAAGIATGEIVLSFADPLPDDRYTLTLLDSIIDPAGNQLDGENNAAEPIGSPFFETGDSIPGGDFIARFTVDSRPEVATWSQGVVYADINGNFVWDPEGKDNDFTNRDFAYNFGEITDAYFAGNFSSVATSSGFDKVGAYGAFNGTYEFFLDTDDDGIGDTVGSMAFQVNAIPVAGNFFNSAADDAAVLAGQRPRDEIGAFDGQSWYLDVNGNNNIDAGERFPTELRGIPVVGDFNGDGNDDLATFNNDTGVFQFDLDRDGTIDNQVTFGFSGFGEKPVAGDFNLDGIDDIGLWVPGREGQLPKQAGEFHFLISDTPANLPSNVFEPFSPAPLGNDFISQFGDDFALPLFGNFDPPVSPDGSGATFVGSLTNDINALDTNLDGRVSALDALVVINALRDLRENPVTRPSRTVNAFNGLRLDASADGNITALDALYVINGLKDQAGAGNAEGEMVRPVSVPVSWSLAADSALDSSDDENDDLLDLLAYDQELQRIKS